MHKRIASFLFIITIFVSGVQVFAANPTSPFSAGDNILDPGALTPTQQLLYGITACSPLDSNCYVTGSGSVSGSSTTTLATTTLTTLYSSTTYASSSFVTNGTTTNLFADLFNSITSFITNLNVTNSTTTNSTTTNLSAGNVVATNTLTIMGSIKDAFGSIGSLGQVLSSTGTSTQWITLSAFGGSSTSTVINSTTTTINSSTTTISSATTTLIASTTNIFSTGTTTLTSNTLYINASSTTITGLTNINNLITSGSTTFASTTIFAVGLTVASATPATTTNTIYNLGGTLYWNGSTLGGTSLVTNSTTTIAGAITNINSTTTNITSSATTTITSATTTLIASTTNIFSTGTTTLTSNTLYINASTTTITGTTTLASLVLGTLNGPLFATNGAVSAVSTGTISISAGAANVATSGAGYVLGGNLNFTIGTGNFTAPSNPEVTISGGANSVLGAGVTITIPDANGSTRGLVTTGTQNFAGVKTFVNGFTSSATSSMSGVLNMNSNLISNLGTPVNGTDAVNKSYVDSVVVSGVATSSVLSIGTTTAPGSPTSGDRFLLQAGNSGYGSCTTNNVAQWSGAAWICNSAATGTSLLVTNTGYNYQFNGASWVQTSGAISVAQLTGKQGGDGSNYFFLGATDYANLTSGSAQLSQLLTTGAPTFAGLSVSGTTTLNGIQYTWPATQASNTVLSTNGAGVLSWITALTASLATGNIFVGNGGGQAAAVALSGDATINSTGVLSLANSGVASGTYGTTTSTVIPIITVDSKGRITNIATTSPTFQTLVATTSTTTYSTTTGYMVVTGTTTLATTTITNLSSTNSTLTNSTSTNLFTTNASISNATTTNLFTQLLSAFSSIFQYASVTNLLTVNNLNATGTVNLSNALVLASSTALSTTTFALYNNNGTLYWNGSAVGGGGGSSGSAGAVQLSNGLGGFVSTSTFTYSTSTNILSFGPLYSPTRIFSTVNGDGLGINSLFIGQGTGNASVSNTGNSNIGIGASALSSVTTAINNIAIGVSNLTQTTTGGNNVAIGINSMFKNITGSQNVGLGTNSLFNASSTTVNTAIGDGSLFLNVTGSANSTLGAGTLYYNKSATNTVAIGYLAGMGINNYANQGSVYVGTYSGQSAGTSSDYNVFLGFQSGYGVTTGSNNLILGSATSSQTINNLTTGNQNILIGNNIGFASSTANGQLNIGNAIFGTGLTTVGTTITSGGIGIGTTTSIYGGNLTAGLTVNNALVLAASSSFSTTTSALYNNNGTLYWNGSAVGGSNGSAGSIQLSNGAGGFVSTSTFTYATATNILSFGPLMGSIRMFSTTTGTGLGVYNMYIGNSAGNTTGTNIGSNNMGIGAGTLQQNTSGSGNTTLGVFGMSQNRTGTNNVAVGLNAMFGNVTGIANVAVGANALYNSSSSDANTAIGNSSLYSNITGQTNTAIGSSALYFNKSATGTVAVGVGAGSGLTSYANQGGTYLGTNAGYSAATSSDYNVFIGLSAGYGVTTGSNNILIGSATSTQTVHNLTTGSQNILIGNNIGFASSTANGQLNIGNAIFGTGLTTVGTTVTSGGIGIGTTTNIYGGNLTTGLTLSNALVLASSTALSTTTSALYNSNGTLFWNGSALGGGWQSAATTTFIASNLIQVAIGTTTAKGSNKLTIYNGGLFLGLATSTTGVETLPVIASTTLSGVTGMSTVAYGNYLINVNTDGDYSVVDVTDPINVRKVSSITNIKMGLGENKIFGNYLFTGNNFNIAGVGQDAMFKIYDVTNVASPTLVAHVATSTLKQNAFSFDMYNGNLIVLGAASTSGISEAILYKFNIKNINNPTIIATSSPITSNYYNIGSRVKVKDGYAYVSIGENAQYLRVYDIRGNNLNQISQVLVASSGGFGGSFEISGNYAYVSTGSGLAVVDISNPAVPVLIGGGTSLGFNIANNVQNYMAMSGRYVYLSNTTNLAVVDVSSSTRPTLVYQIQVDPDNDFSMIQMVGKYIYWFNSSNSTISTIDTGGVDSHSGKIDTLVSQTINATGKIIARLIEVADGIVVGSKGIVSSGVVTVNNGLVVNGYSTTTNGTATSTVDAYLYLASTSLSTTSNMSSALYNQGGTLYWNGTALTGGSVSVPLSLTNVATSGAIIVLRDGLGATSTEIRAGTSTLRNTFMGIDTGSSIKTGSNNSAYGVNALMSAVTGSNNSAFGYMSLASSTGSNNTAYGVYSLASTTSGFNNTAFGYTALRLNITGQQNTALGLGALGNSTSTSFNLAIGNNSLSSLTTGDDNVAIGMNSLLNLVSGIRNVAIGRSAASQNLASGTVAVGYGAGYGQVGAVTQGGTFLGSETADSLGNGSDYNTFVGFRAGKAFTGTNSSYNIILGSATTTSGTLQSGSNNILIGNGVMGGLSTTGSNQLNIGNLIFGSGLTNGVTAISSGGIGIGTSTNIYGSTLTQGLTLNNALVLASSTAISTTTLALYNNNSVLYWNGGEVQMTNATWYSANAASTNQWDSVKYLNGRFIATAFNNSFSGVMTSTDGVNWTSQSTPGGAKYRSSAYGNNTYVIVAQDNFPNQVETSPDTITWTSRNSSINRSWKDVTYGAGLFVAVASDAATDNIMTSPDGITWTTRSKGETHNLYSVIYAGGQFVAVGATNVYTSPDGITWTTRTPASVIQWNSVTYGNGLYVAVSSLGTTANQIMTSPDGITWTSRTSPVDADWNNVTFGKGVFVAVGITGNNSQRVMISTDGINWSSRTAAQNNSWQWVTYGNGLFVAVSSDGTNRVMYSSGINGFAQTTGNIASGTAITLGSLDSGSVSLITSGVTRLFADSTSGGVGIGTSTNIYGGTLTSGLTLNNALVLASSTAISTTSQALYNNNGTLYWNGGIVGSTTAIRISNSSAVSIGTSSSPAMFTVQGTSTSNIAVFQSTGGTGCAFSALGVISCSSDGNLKKNLASSTYGLETVLELSPTTFNWKTEDETATRTIGFIAQDVQKVLPGLVNLDNNGKLQLNQTGLIPVLTKALQDMNKKIFGNGNVSKLSIEEVTASTTISLDEKFRVLGTNAKEVNEILAQLASSTSATSSVTTTEVVTVSTTTTTIYLNASGTPCAFDSVICNVATTTISYNYSTSTVSSTTLTFVGKLFERISAWLGDAGNGIKTLFVGEVKAKDKICVGETCLTEEQLKDLLRNSSTTSGQSSGQTGNQEERQVGNGESSSGEQPQVDNTPTTEEPTPSVQQEEVVQTEPEAQPEQTPVTE